MSPVGRRILVVDDNIGAASLCGRLLAVLGPHQVELAYDGRSALERIRTFSPDIVLLDINLPRTNGYEILKQIRADEKLKDVIVVAVTAQDADSEIPKCKEAGFDGYIGKPLSRSRFPRQIKRILGGEAVWETY